MTVYETVGANTDDRQSVAPLKTQLFILSLRLAIETATKNEAFESREALQARKAALYKKLYSLCADLFQAPHRMQKGSLDEIKLAISSRLPLDEKLLGFHIVQSFVPIIGIQAAQRIVLMCAGTASSKADVTLFLEQG